MGVVSGPDKYRPKLIAAAADAGQYNAPPPRILVTAWQIKRWGALPEAGGLLDQPAGLLSRAGYVLDVYNAHRSWRNALETLSGDGLAQWQEQNPQIMRLLADIREARRGN